MQYTQPLQAGLNCVAPPARNLGVPNDAPLTSRQSSAAEVKA